MVPPVHRKLITSSLMLTVATLNGIVPRGRARVTLGGLRRFRREYHLGTLASTPPEPVPPVNHSVKTESRPFIRRHCDRVWVH
jgi:hypothetical protein